METLTEPATAPSIGAQPSAPRRSPALRLAVAGVVTAQVVLLALAGRRGQYIFDDLYNYANGHAHRLTWSYLNEREFDHWFPAFRFANWLVPRLGPVHYRLTLAVAIGMIAASTVLMWFVLRRLFGAGPGSVALLVVYALSTVWIRPTLWWSASLNVAIGNLAVVFAIWAYLRYADRRPRSGLAAVGSVAALAVGLAFYEKPIVALPFLLLIAVAMRSTWRSALAALRREVWYWASVGVLAAAYLVNDLAFAESSHTPPPLADLARLAARTWSVGAGPAALMGGWTLRPDFPAAPLGLLTGPAGVVTTTVVVTVVLFAWSGWRAISARGRGGHLAGRPAPTPLEWLLGWTMALGAVCGGAVLVGYARFSTYRFAITRNGQYLADGFVFVAIGLGFALAGRAGAGDGTLVAGAAGGRRRPRTRRTTAAVAWIAVGAFALVHVAALAHGAVWSARRWHDYGSAAYFGRLEAGLDREKDLGHPLVVWQRPVPTTIEIPNMAPFNQLSRILPLLRTDVRFQDPASGGLLVEPDGSVRPARYAATDTGTPTSAACGAAGGNLVAASAPVAVMLAPLNAGGAGRATPPGDTGLPETGLYLHLDLRVAGGGDVVVAAGPDTVGLATATPGGVTGTPVAKDGDVSVTIPLSTQAPALWVSSTSGSWCIRSATRGVAVPSVTGADGP